MLWNVWSLAVGRHVRMDKPCDGEAGSCCRPLHVASGIGRGRAVGPDPPTPWLPEGRRQPEPSPAAYRFPKREAALRLIPVPFGFRHGPPELAWLATRTMAPSGSGLCGGQRNNPLNHIIAVLDPFTRAWVG